MAVGCGLALPKGQVNSKKRGDRGDDDKDDALFVQISIKILHRIKPFTILLVEHDTTCRLLHNTLSRIVEAAQ